MLLDIISDSHISYGDNEDTLVSQDDFFEFVEQTLNDWDNGPDIADAGGLPHTEEIRESIQKLKREFEEYDSAHPDLEDVTIALRA